MKTYTDKTRYLFVQLRARGVSLGTISKELDVPKSTVGDWDKSFADEIARLRAIEWEAVEEQFGRTLEQDLRAMAERIRRWEAAIDRLNPGNCRVREMLAVLRDTRREYFRRRAILMSPLENTLTRAVTRSLNRHPDEAGRYTFLPPTPLHNPNDLQQPPTEPSGDGARPSPVAATIDQRTAVNEASDVKINQPPPTALPSPGGEGQGEGDSSVAASQTAQPNEPVEVSSSDGSNNIGSLTRLGRDVPVEPQAGRPKSDLFPDESSDADDTQPETESIVVNPHECMRSVLEKCLAAEASRRAA